MAHLPSLVIRRFKKPGQQIRSKSNIGRPNQMGAAMLMRAETRGRVGRLLAFAWTLSLVCVPFFIARQTNPIASGRHLLVAPGLTLGMIAFEQASRIRQLELRRNVSKAIIAAGAALALFFVVPEWLLFPLGVLGERTSSLFGSGSYVNYRALFFTAQGIAVFIASISAGFYSSWTHKNGRRPITSNPKHLAVRGAVAIGCLQALVQLLLCREAQGQAYSLTGMLLAEFVSPFMVLCLFPFIGQRAEAAGPIYTLALAIGSSVPCLLTRVIPYIPHAASAYPVILVISLVLYCASLIQKLIHGRDERSRQAGSSEIGIKSSPVRGELEASAIEGRLSKYRLAPREKEIATAFAGGKTSSEIAIDLGIKPSTVRATMQRVYKKMEVAGKDQFLALISPLEDNRKKALPEKEDEQEEESREATRPQVLPFTIIGITCAVVFLLSNGPHPPYWGINRPFVYGVSLGLLLSALHLVAPSERMSKIARRVPLSFAGLLLLVASRYLTTGYGQEGASGALLLSTLGIWLVALAASSSDTSRGDSELASGSDTTPSSYMRHILFPFIALLLGFSWEEACRGTVWLSFFPSTIAFIALCAASSPLSFYKSGEKGKAVLLAAAILVSLFARYQTLLLACGALGFLALLERESKSRPITRLEGASIVASLGLGPLFGDFLINTLGVYIAGNDAFAFAIGGKVALETAASLLIAIITATAGCFALANLVGNITNEAVFNMPVVKKARSRERARYALLGHGFNETQVTVALDILAGKSSADIARSRHYSRGTINSARNTVYKTLGVHNRFELALLLQQVNDL